MVFPLTGDEPAEDEEGGQRVPGDADAAEGVGGAVFGLPGTGQAREDVQHQAEESQDDQVHGDVGLPRTFVQVNHT